MEAHELPDKELNNLSKDAQCATQEHRQLKKIRK